MNQAFSLLGHMFQQPEPETGDYTEDGLLYCGKCRTRRQMRIDMLGTERVVPVMCQCREEAQALAEAERRKQEFFEHVSRLKTRGLQDARLYDYRFANDKGYTPKMEVARRYVDSWKKMEEQGMGLLLWGKVGTGKSFMAGCIANALIEQGIPVLMTNFGRILNSLTGVMGDERNRVLKDLNKYSLLILDDLGVERGTEYAMEQIFTIVDSRYRVKKPFIVTTNLTLDDMKQTADVAKARVFDRILERCVPVALDGPSIRQQNARENMEMFREMLEG